MLTRCAIYISLKCPATFTEVLADDMESTAVALESSISLALVELFGEGIILEDVTVEQYQSDCKCEDEFCRHT